MTSNTRRRSVWILSVFVLGWVLGYFFCITIGIINCDVGNSLINKEGKFLDTYKNISAAAAFPKTLSQKRSPQLRLEQLGIVYDCLTWDVRYRYSPDVLINEYSEFPEVVDGAEGDGQRQKAFVDIYNRQLWNNLRDREVNQAGIFYKASGPGASLEAAQGVMAVLHIMIDKLKQDLNKTQIKILDLPCGDLQWMSHFLATRSDVHYTGMDIVPALIEKHKKNYSNKPNMHFQHFDIVKSKLDNSYDFVVCRMMLQHLLNMDVLKALYHFSLSNSLYFGATTFSGTDKNEELIPIGGRLRFLNLEKPPISLSPPMCTYQEPAFPDHHFAIWKLPLHQHK